MTEFTIGKHRAGGDNPCFIIAELSCNHRGKYTLAEELVRTAADSGADAVKLQTDNPDGGITIDCDNEHFQIKDGPWKGRTLYDLYKETYTPWEWTVPLMDLANSLGMELFSTPSCIPGVDFLEGCGVPAYKVSSFEVTDAPLLRRMAETGKPVLVSLGCYQDSEDAEAVELVMADEVPRVFLRCVSQYPAPPGAFNLCEWVEGISDHSLGNEISIAAVALGAQVVERHLMLGAHYGGPDVGFSLDPWEFKQMVTGIRNVEAAMRYSERQVDRTFCKSLFAVKDIKAGERFTKDNVGVIRPGAGMHPKHYDRVLQCRAKANIPRGTPLGKAML